MGQSGNFRMLQMGKYIFVVSKSKRIQRKLLYFFNHI